MSNPELPINISIYDNNKEKIKNADNSSQEYIIQSNEYLSNQNKQYIVKIKDIQAAHDDLEKDNDKLERSLTYMRGFLHNNNELLKAKEKYIKVFFNYHKNIFEYTNALNKNIITFMNSIFLSLFIFYILLFISWISGYNNIINIIITTIYLILACTISFVYYNVNIKYYIKIANTVNSFNISTLNGKKQIDTESKKIKELIDSNDNISEYIDIM